VSPPPFEELVAEHGPTVLRVCRAVLGPADAEDAWSETFLAALDAPSRPLPRLQRLLTEPSVFEQEPTQ